MQRLNIFDNAHNALRDTLYSTALRLQRIDVHVRAEAYAAIVQVRRSLEQLEEHMRLEEAFVFDALFEYEPGIIDSLLQQQQTSKAIIKRVSASLNEINLHSPRLAPLSAWKQLSVQYGELVSIILQQMKNEEEMLNAILWCYYSHKHLIAVQQQIEKGILEKQPQTVAMRKLPALHQPRISVPELLNSITMKQAL